jgi:methyltransferase-like protein 6
MKVLEIGCGYGSSIFPILSRSDSLYADVCDFSSQAIQILMSNPLYDPLRCRAFVCDIVKDPLNLPQDSFDAVLLIFALSALAPASLPSVVEKIRDVLKPGGVVCFRDYGLFDLAMMRNAKCISSSVYYRSDGTIAHFFSIEDIEGLFNTESGFKVVENKYCTVRLQNRKNGKLMDRVWLHAKIRKCL